MSKKPILAASICIIVLLVLGSLNNVVGYQTIRSSNQQKIREGISQRDLLFQTIVDLTNNKEIQRIILKSHMNQGIFPIKEIPVLTKNQLKHMFIFRLLLLKVVSKARIPSLLEKYPIDNQVLQKELSDAIEKEPTLEGEITQLQNEACDCGNKKTTGAWAFPIICTTLLVMMVTLAQAYLFLTGIFGPIAQIFSEYLLILIMVLSYIVQLFECPWIYYPY